MTKENKKWSCVLLAALAGLFASHSLSAESTERNNSNSLFAKFTSSSSAQNSGSASEETGKRSESATSEPANASGKTYQVKAGQGLWAVAQAAWGSGNEWRRLITLNPALANRPKNSDGSPVIYVGEYLNV